MWPSGRRRSPAKGVGGKPSRGFESLRFRHLPFINIVISIIYVKMNLLAPQMAPHLARKIISALASNNG